MSWFVDASVIVALSVREPDWEHHADRMDEEAVRYWSPMAQWESVAATRVRLDIPAGEARVIVDRVARTNGFALVPIGENEARAALLAFERYGKGTGHPAQLNMGDCFAYACAKANGARLLYKGDDFSQTDLA
ncbi:ribonuclease VapC [Sphingomonas sp. BE138]|uniref:type II toxin-antitoxin system VapC family toxin n=1 Tax=Sphingomonas sp. BE138 TaxID=2817845 RepID=UPI002856EC96|nr:type II toxin-antitoxin system VapC family toxin [Sphingomonas sp. BE138]MDR6788203.1 ribonuclease VapC [Sphingomonas sp. BE138]